MPDTVGDYLVHALSEKILPVECYSVAQLVPAESQQGSRVQRVTVVELRSGAECITYGAAVAHCSPE